METIPRSSGEVTDAENEVRQVSTGSKSVLTTDTAATTTTAVEGDSNVVENEQDECEVYDDEDEEEDDYEYEDDDDVAYSGFLDDSAPPEQEEEAVEKPKWRQPSEAAVSMSLRAETEKTGGRRRLAQDLYRIMNQDTEEAGFSLAPVEDTMDKWTIKLFGLDEDSNLAKDMKVLGISNIEIEMNFPEHYPFEPPFVRVVRPRFKRQTGFVMNGALCMELLTKDGWNPINDIESVIVSIRSLLVVGDGRLEAALNLPESKYNELLQAASESHTNKKQKTGQESKATDQPLARDPGSYSASEAQAAYSHLSDYHKKKGWDSSGWWARKG